MVDGGGGRCQPAISRVTRTRTPQILLERCHANRVVCAVRLPLPSGAPKPASRSKRPAIPFPGLNQESRLIRISKG